MNRRRVLQSAGALVAISFAGCLEGVQDHFEGGVQGIVPIEIYSEADQYYNVQLQAYEHETNRQTYDEGYSVTGGDSVIPPHLEATRQSLRVVKFGADGEEQADVREVTITPETELVLIWIYDDDLVLDVHRGDVDGAANETPTPPDEEDVEDDTADSDDPGTNGSEADE
ncbi:hypothetical protein EA462_08010 [Natrarchaeobius halalkaliphilus]|uniref:Uncharacterized protein n=1 Tax=Natrarchaeobius halalkaliphilus TaxID=1679091 RepID=A0A3N6P3P6_9EURY|nr:hypothetical protein [Natrarchaeobius halalkaliphilus]RQG89945.1 hypothetical protein EA462_08010 [Natrarchaeobius halalkaliphilus]